MTAGRPHVVIADGAAAGSSPVRAGTRSVDPEVRTVSLDDGTRLRVRLAGGRTR